jgi:hypothetical protein
MATLKMTKTNQNRTIPPDLSKIFYLLTLFLLCGGVCFLFFHIFCVYFTLKIKVIYYAKYFLKKCRFSDFYKKSFEVKD